MSRIEFDEFIKEQSSKNQEVNIDWDQRLTEWKDQLDKFYRTVKGFLGPYSESGQINIEESNINLHEEYIGKYAVKELIIHLGSNNILLEPIGTNLIAARGRVDMIGPKGEVKFLLVPKESSGPQIRVHIRVQGDEPPPKETPSPVAEWSWKIATPPPKISYIELEEESFKSALMEVVSG